MMRIEKRSIYFTAIITTAKVKNYRYSAQCSIIATYLVVDGCSCGYDVLAVDESHHGHAEEDHEQHDQNDVLGLELRHGR